ncbi:MAG: M23 family metallopeptidase [Alphaproteobacteria bacterium]
MSGRPASFGTTARFGFGGGERSAAYADLGTEPPLTVGSPSMGIPARRAVSIRWLSGTILTGLTAFVLMGGALAVALNGQQIAAVPPETADLGLINANISIGEKGDRILPVAAPPTTREIVTATVTVREGDRELFQQRDYAFINATLAAATGEGVEIPPYDPVRIVGDAANNQPTTLEAVGAEELAGGVNGGNAAVRSVPFPSDAPADAGPALDTSDVVAMVRSNASLFSASANTWPMMLAFANAAGLGLGLPDEAANAIGFRAIPENVGYLAKAGQDEVFRDESMIQLADRTSLAELLVDAGVAHDDVDETVGVLDGLMDLTTLSGQHQARVAFVPDTVSATVRQLLRVSIYEDGTHQATVARGDDGVFVRADEPGPLPAAVEPTSRVVSGAPRRLYDALYLTAVEQGVPESQLSELVGIFAFELDMLSTVGPADTVSLFHGVSSEEAAILFASVTVGGSTASYYRFQSSDGVVNYYDGNGASADNFLLRKPMSGGDLRSGYGNRLHPVLGVYRLHSGVDWAAPAGTPIVAAGDGEIVRLANNSGGYGRHTVIRHANGYETAYSHQSRFAEGLAEGDRVRQGQVIGYVGSTGLSTGNHLHYEVRINGQTVNPLTIRLPEGRILTGDNLIAFAQARDQINDLLGITLDDGQVATTN